METPEPEDSLWIRFKEQGAEDARSKIILKYVHLVKFVVNRIVSGHSLEGEFSSYDDLYSVGILGLIEAIGGFDLTRGVKFTTYAVPRIRGAVIDELRALDWVPRSLRTKVGQLQRAYAEIENQHLRPATDEEVSEKLGITLKDLDGLLMNASRISVLSLDEEVWVAGDSDISRADITEARSEDPRAGIHREEIQEIMKQAVRNLPEKERLVVALYYINELTFKEIGEVLEVTESRVCQLHSKAVSRLRGRLRDFQQDLAVV